MAKKNYNADVAQDQPISDQTSGDVSVSSAAPPAATVNTVTMEDFISRPDRASWLSVADAAKYLTDVRGATDIDSQKMRNASNNRKEFAADGAMLKVAVPGYEIKPLTYLHNSAVDLYHDNNVNGNTRSARVIANGKRWIVRIKAADHAAVVAALEQFGIALEVASVPHKKDADADADASADAPATDASSNGTAHADDQPIADQPFVDMQRTEEFDTTPSYSASY